MNKIVTVLIINYFMKTVITENVTTEYETAYENLFRVTNFLIQKTINELFFKLKLNKNFIDLNTNRVLLAMHTKLKTISSENYEKYIIAVAGVKYYERVIPNLLFKIDTLMDEIFNELFVIRYKKCRNNVTTPSDTMPNFRATTDTSYNILKEFIKAEGHSIEDEDSPLENIKKIIEERLQRKSRAMSNFKVWSSTNSSEPGKLNNSRRMFGGQTINIEKYPFVASVHVNKIFACTGAIVSRDMILSAASCVQEQTQTFRGETADSIIIRIGSDYTYRDGVTLQATAVYFHPGYDPSSLQHNLVLIKMQKRARLRQKKKIRRVEFHSKNHKLPPSTRSITLMGWSDQTKHTGGEILSFTDLDIYNKHDCEEVYTLKYVSKNTFCAGYITKGDGACIKDVGGPAIIGSTLIGLVSFGPPTCGTKDAPTVFTDLGHYVKWIDEILKTKSNVRIIKHNMSSPTKSGDSTQNWDWPPIIGQIAKKLQSGVQRLSAPNINDARTITSTDNVKPCAQNTQNVEWSEETNEMGKATYTAGKSFKEFPGVRMLANLLNQVTGNAGKTVYDNIKSSSIFSVLPQVKETSIKQNKTEGTNFENLVKSSIDVLRHFISVRTRGSTISTTLPPTESSFLQNMFGTWNMFEVTTGSSMSRSSLAVSKAVIEPNVLHSTQGIQVKIDTSEKFGSRSCSSEESKYYSPQIGRTPTQPHSMENVRQPSNPYLDLIIPTGAPEAAKKHPREFSELIIKRLGEQFLRMNLQKNSERYNRAKEDPLGNEFILYLLDQKSKHENFMPRTSNDTENENKLKNKDSGSVEIAPYNSNATVRNGSSSEYEFYEYETNLTSNQDDDFQNKIFLEKHFTSTNTKPTESIQPDTLNETTVSDVKIENTPILKIIYLNENKHVVTPNNYDNKYENSITTINKDELENMQYNFNETKTIETKYSSTNFNDMGTYNENKNVENAMNIANKEINEPDATNYSFKDTTVSYNKFEEVSSSTNKNDMGFYHYFENKNDDNSMTKQIKDTNDITQYNFNKTTLSNNKSEKVINSKRGNDLSFNIGDFNENRNVANSMNTANEPGDMQYDFTETTTTDSWIKGTIANDMDGFNYNNENKNVEDIEIDDLRDIADPNDARRELLYYINI